MLEGILFALWFFLPAGAANGAPVFANNIKSLDRFGIPLDGGKSFRGKRIFGNHKTLRGLVFGVLNAVLVVATQMLLYNSFEFFRTISRSIDYSEPRILILGFALGFGALAGDAIKSFFKRQLSLEPGRGWFPYDQTDYIIGGLLCSIPFVQLELSQYLWIGVIWFVIHPVANIIGWLLHLKDSPF